MRLEKIKLAGFKSFVDSTVITFSSNFTAIVGPNGCGKSNVIDAVRWVLGESSAKHLRGDQMADVIFNGSATRKPVGLCFVELVFNNEAGRIGGEFAAYNQISIKREINRQGQSTYFLNNVRCRRKDITGLFLGTGLGPRSYAIIEQGTISRLIEAKPAELRLFLEEAAGISKYKERRRETENRIRRTRDNLNRLDDLCNEVDKQCHHLKHQAATAERYKAFKELERQLNLELIVLCWFNLASQSDDEYAGLLSMKLAVEEAVTALNGFEVRLEKQRMQTLDQQFELNKCQENIYRVNAEISKLEHTRQHDQERSREQKLELVMLQKTLTHHLGEQVKVDTEALALLGQVETSESSLGEVEVERDLAEKTLLDTEAVWRESQASCNKLSLDMVESNRELELAKLRNIQIEERFQLLQKQLLECANKQRDFRRVVEQSGLLGTEAEAAELDADYETGQNLLPAYQQRVESCRDNRDCLEASLMAMNSEHALTAGRLESVQHLLNAGQTQISDEVNQWLLDSGLDSTNTLVDHLEVKAGWERAVNIVLGDRLQSICVEDFSSVLSELTVLPAGVSLFDSGVEQHSFSSTALASVVSSHFPVISLLASVHIAENIAEAMRRLKALAPHESVITQEGVWLHADAVSCAGGDDECNLLFLSKEKKTLSAALQQASAAVEQLKIDLLVAKQSLQGAETQLVELQQKQVGLVDKRAVLTIQLNKQRGALEQAEKGLLTVERDRAAAEADCLKTQSEGRAYVADVEEASMRGSQLKKLSEQHQGESVQLKQAFDQAGLYARNMRDKLQVLQLSAESQRSAEALVRQRADSIKQSINLSEDKLSQLEQKIKVQAPALDAQLERLNQQQLQRMNIEYTLQSAQTNVQETEQLTADIEQKRVAAGTLVQVRREAHNQAELNHQQVIIRKAALLEQVQGGEEELNKVFGDMPSGASEPKWRQKIRQLLNDIDTLGAVNLVAIDEYESQLSKKEYLDVQLLDLNESLYTLERAMGKIDKESRSLFQQTFDKVNAGFEQRFPKLFGGGRAYLQLSGDDLLEAGVSVMARPPGKRNSSIHLLSGGEKALTAVALVFSIFDLNPSPLCMLDEVDAPLDEANVERFAEFVKEMSRDVQMTLITHNKVTMELANQLAGVTMKEPGVSRLVTVDLESAVKMAH